MPSLYIPACGLFVAILMLLSFFTRKKLFTIETALFSIMLVSSTIDLLITNIVIFIGYVNTNYPNLVIFLNKIDFAAIVFWVSSLSLYIFYITFKERNINTNKVFKLVGLADIICILLTSVLPTKLYNDGIIMYAFGPSVSILYLISGIHILSIIICVIIGYKNILSKKYMPVYGLILLIVIMMVVRKINPGLVTIPSGFAFINLILLLTLENPDLKIIRELSEAKKIAEKNANEKEIFSFNMSQKIKDPIKDIEVLCEDLSSSNDIKELKEGINNIRISSSKIKYLVNDTLSKVSPDKIDIRENEYNTSLLFKEVNYYIKNKASKYNVSFVESKFNKEVVAKGDNLKIKQIICSFATNLLKEIKSMILTLNTNVVENENDYLVSFKFIIPKINITLEELNKNEEIGKYEELDFDNISLSKLKKLINLLDGYIEIKNVDEELMEITINFEQAKSVIKDNKSLSLIDEYEKEVNKPKIMLVDDDNDTKNISRYINNHKYDLTIATSGQEALELVRNNNEYDLILLDDDLDKLDTITVFDKFNAIDGFNTPVIYVGDVSNKDKEADLLDIGFSAVLLKPIKQKEIDEIIDKYIK